MRATTSYARVLASARWTHDDGELVVASERVNPGLRDALARRFPHAYESLHFTVFLRDGATVVLHRLKADEIDNDIAEIVASELARPGAVGVPNAFERCFAGVVLSSAESSGEAWRAFYENTLSKLEKAAPDGDSSPTAVFGKIYERALSRVAGSSLLDVGSCFGFFPFLVNRAEPGVSVTALDISEPMVALARNFGALSPHAKNVSFVHGDALGLPFDDGTFDTVAALHVLEHLTPPDAYRALCEMRRVARRRVVVAVPLESDPDPAYGHVQSFDRKSLTELTRAAGWRSDFEEYLGGWVVMEPRG
jgi:SAM-dependent methyltransferase